MRIELIVGGIDFFALWGPIMVWIPRSRYFSSINESFRMGVASLNLVDELIKAHRLRIFSLPENFICLQ